ncbi:60S acidic ribosomal protein [Vigna angularis]|uniref:60S acidic ribosomal protein n=1 Tax=Phaseolus angularis TaxID=3914 RepID=A0A8T0KES3_PHAAN|nr:60S acidic ribosomal protein [Vigna angularis]
MSEKEVEDYDGECVKMSVGETACSYASIILHDEGIAVTVSFCVLIVESYWPTLFAKLAEKKNLGDLIANAAGGGAPAAVAAAPVAAAGGGAAAAAPAAEEKKKEEPEEESDDDMGFGLFD